MPEFDETTPVINEDTVDHYCFGCGNLNPHGLRLRFRRLEEDGVWATFAPTQAHEGYLSMTHGGILATMLDEAMSWAVTNAGDLGVTGRLSIAFRSPARVGAQLRVVGRVVRRTSRTIDATGEISDVSSGVVVAEADGRFVRIPRQQAAAWKAAYGSVDDGSVFGVAANRNAGVVKD